jgi:uncharacterized membrane protein YphA (DoxX/SURF4 family)
MAFAAKLRRAPLRIATGAYILNEGVGKLTGDDEKAKGIHEMASNAYPMLGGIEPRTFLKLLGAGETALGATLLLPVVPAAVAGLGLMAFSGALLGFYWRTPHLHEPNSPRPTQLGSAIAKDVWMFGIGTSLVVDAALSESKVTATEQ